MTERWVRIGHLFDAALAQPPDQRSAFLARECGGDPETFAEVKSLLASHDAADRFLESTPFSMVARACPSLDDRDPLLGRVLGRYRIERVIAAGGMGTVYLAHRDDDAFDMPVAVKVVKRGMDTDEVLQRFRSEQQLLVELRHPSIARILDAGVTADGRPYYVMEYICGAPITRAADRMRLTIDDRLRLFVRVCAAVHHAHRHLVIHRDLKPANILVDEAGDPHLLDFGIAKILDPALPGYQTRTDSEAPRLTPDYASPEQLAGDKITTSTDTYSLGVLLYELLAGCLPHDLAGLTRDKAGAHKQTALPRRMSERVRYLDEEDVSAVAGARGLSPRRLVRRLSGDLDRIVAMATHPEAERRYESVEQLAADIERHFVGEPVLARPGDTAYRVTRFLSRYRVAVGTTLLLFVLLGSAGYYAYRQGRQARIHYHEANDATVILCDLFRSLHPALTSSHTGRVSADDLLDQSVKFIREHEPQRQDVLSAILCAVAQAYLGIGKLPEAVRIADEVIPIRRAFYGDDSLEVVEAEVVLASSLIHTPEEVPRALAAIEHAVRVVEQVHPNSGAARAAAVRIAQATLQLVSGRPEDAAEAVAMARRHLDSAPPRTEFMLLRADCLKLDASLAPTPSAALDLLREALAIKLSHQAAQHPDVLRTRHQIAFLTYLNGEAREAAELFESLLAERRMLLPDDHRDLALTLLGLAVSRHRAGQFEDALPVAAEAATVFAAASGDPEYYAVADANSIAGDCLVQLGRYEEAEPILLTATEVLTRRVGPQHEHTLESAHRLAQLYRQTGRLDAARRVEETAGLAPPSPGAHAGGVGEHAPAKEGS